MRLRRGRTAGLPTPRRQATERPPPPAEFPAGITHRRALSVRSDDAYALVWSPDGRYIASGGEDKVLRVWDAQTGESHAQLDGHSGYIHSVSWSPDGRLVASAGEDRVVRVWDAQAGQEHRQLIGQSGCAYSVSWSPDGRLIASAGADEVVRVWNAETAEPQRQLQGHTGCVASVSWSPDGRILVLKLDDGALEVWDTATWEVVAAVYEGGIGLPWQPPDERAFHPTRPLLATKGVRPSERIRILEFDVDALVGASG